jgi:glycosyltransferase involved in cell wall biosynthesis
VVVGGASIWDHGELEQRFDARVRALPRAVRHRIHRTGAVEEAALTWLYRRSDVLFCPSLHEGWGLCALEALAAGTAVIASEREPFTEFLDRDTAWLVDPDSTRDLALALATLASDADHRADLARAGRRRAREFSWQRTARAHLEAYRALIAARRAPSVASALAPTGA